MELYLGENIRKYRELRGFSVDQLAEKMGIGKAGIYKWEQGENNPSIESLTEISKALDVAISVLLGENPTPVNKNEDIAENPEEIYRKLVEANTAYRLVPKTILDEEYRIILKSELEDRAQMWKETLTAKNNLIDQLHKEIEDLRASIPDTKRSVHAKQTQ